MVSRASGGVVSYRPVLEHPGGPGTDAAGEGTVRSATTGVSAAGRVGPVALPVGAFASSKFDSPDLGPVLPLAVQDTVTDGMPHHPPLPPGLKPVGHGDVVPEPHFIEHPERPPLDGKPQVPGDGLRVDLAAQRQCLSHGGAPLLRPVHSRLSLSASLLAHERDEVPDLLDVLPREAGHGVAERHLRLLKQLRFHDLTSQQPVRAHLAAGGEVDEVLPTRLRLAAVFALRLSRARRMS